MPSTVKTRQDDEQLLHMLELRDMGYSSTQVGNHYGLASSTVRTMTNKVYDAIRKETNT